MKSLLILGCSATKRHDAGVMPAVERYDGPLYRVLRKWMRETPDHTKRLAVAILSAQWGMVPGSMPIEDYDARLTKGSVSLLAALVQRDFRYLLGPYASVYISLGAQYREALPNPLPWPAEFAQGGIGDRQHDLKRWLSERKDFS